MFHLEGKQVVFMCFLKNKTITEPLLNLYLRLTTSLNKNNFVMSENFA